MSCAYDAGLAASGFGILGSPRACATLNTFYIPWMGLCSMVYG